MMPAHFTTTSLRKRKKFKFTSAANAKVSRENKKDWDSMLKTYDVNNQKASSSISPIQKKPLSYRGSDLPRIPSLKDTWAPCYRASDKVYTGNLIVGISTMHKSNAVPILSKEEAIDMAKMRR